MNVPAFATPVDPERAWMREHHGPVCIPFRDMFGGTSGRPHQPGIYGRYRSIDLDENNRHSVDAYCTRFPDRPRPVFGWGVCRHGFGLQHHTGILSAEEAKRWARDLNASIVIGASEA